MLECDRVSGEFTWSGNADLRWRAWLEVDGRRFGSAAAEITAADLEDGMSTWSLTFTGCPVRWVISGVAESAGAALRLCSRIHNDGDRPVALGQVALDFAAGAARWAVSFKELCHQDTQTLC